MLAKRQQVLLLLQEIIILCRLLRCLDHHRIGLRVDIDLVKREIHWYCCF